MGEHEVQVQEPGVLGKGYYVDTVGKNIKAIDEYISNQLREDELSNQMTLEEPDPFTGNK